MIQGTLHSFVLNSSRLLCVTAGHPCCRVEQGSESRCPEHLIACVKGGGRWGHFGGPLFTRSSLAFPSCFHHFGTVLAVKGSLRPAH